MHKHTSNLTQLHRHLFTDKILAELYTTFSWNRHTCMLHTVLSKRPTLAQCPTDSLVEPDCKQTDLNLIYRITVTAC